MDAQTSTLTTDRRRSNSADHISNYPRALQRRSTDLHRENWFETKPSEFNADMTYCAAYRLRTGVPHDNTLSLAEVQFSTANVAGS